MKKNLVRIVAALLVALLALTLIPLGALAAEPVGDERTVSVSKWVGQGTSISDYTQFFEYGGSKEYGPGETITVKEYDTLLSIDGKNYDFAGFEDWTQYSEMLNKAYQNKWGTADIESIDEDKYNAWLADWEKENAFPFYSKDLKIPSLTATEKETEEFYNYWGNWVYAGYVPHQHALTCWISDGTTHWKNCTVCHAQFVSQNWCQDGDEDRICNVCGGDVPYHEVTVIESEGGKITVNKEIASHRTKITADVETKDGYTFEKLHFTKIRTDGSEQEITRYKKNGQFWTYMPTYDLEVSAEFIKK